MNEQPPTTPVFQPAETGEVLDTAPTPLPAKKRSLKLPIILMVWPAVFIVLAIVLYAVTNFIFASTAETSGSDESVLFGSSNNPLQTVTNIILFLVGILGTTLGPISFIAGLILLIVRLQKK